jgi:hypothetical protein
MRISLLGPGDVGRIVECGKLTKHELDNLVKGVGALLASKGVEVVLVPAKGIGFLIAQEYKKNKGKKIIGAVPRDDKEYGIAHIEKYLSIMDEEINIGDWYDLNGRIASLSDIALCVGFGCGTMCDIAMLKYQYKYNNSKTKLVIFENTISRKLHKEIEADLKEIYYINSVEELGKIIDEQKK